MSNVVQYSVWPNCNNNCKFCLRLQRDTWTKEKMIARLEEIKENIKIVDWKNKYKDGISIMGGEMFFITDMELKEKFLEFIKFIVENIIIPVPTTRLSFVTNGIYNPQNLLFLVLDYLKDTVGIHRVDINVSFDIKYRFDTKERENMCINTINAIRNRYNYVVGVQTILTGYFIEAVFNKKFDIKKFENKVIPGSQLTFLYPHPINPSLPALNDFKFTRENFLKFMFFLRENFKMKYDNFYLSTINSAIYKETGLIDPLAGKEKTLQPLLADGKEIINRNCNHSTLYQCYSDCDKCMLCDLLTLGK